jgi:chaperonin GroEL
MQHTEFKALKFDEIARAELVDGVNLLANAVKVTMGPRGQNVIIERPGMMPHLTKDGVTVAKSINLYDKFRNLGVQMVKEASSRTADVAGDGTTTATVLAQSMFVEGLKMLAAGYSSAELQKGIEYGVKYVIDELKEMSLPITSMEEIAQVGTISANGEESIGELIADAMKQVGKDGIITVEEAKGYQTSLDVVEGLELDRGFLSPYFVTDQDKMAAVLENPVILLINKKLSSLQEILPILEKVSRQQKSLLIIADDVDGEALQGLVLNRMKGTLSVCSLRAPEFGEARVAAMRDLGVMLDCEPVITADPEALQKIELSDLGICKKVLCYKHRTVFVGVGGSEEARQHALAEVKLIFEDVTLDDMERATLTRRMQRLAGGVAVLRVGAATEVELLERKDRVEDALHATQAASEEGIVAGGGMALVRASSSLKKCRRSIKQSEDFRVGVDIVCKACCSPLKQIVENSGESSEIVVQKAIKTSYNSGYNAATGEWVNMFEAGIIDPLKVVRTALENASSVARMLLSVGCAIAEDNECQGDEKTGLVVSA